MDTAETSVLVGGVAANALVLWFFFGPRKAFAATARAGAQEVQITVKGGYAPDVVVVRKGSPVRLNFRREETASCSEQVVFSDFDIVRDLPPFQTTAIEFTPDRTGEFTWTCGMNMMRGKLIVEEGASELRSRGKEGPA